MTLTATPREVLGWNSGSAIASPAAETAILVTDVFTSTIPGGGFTRPVIIRCNLNITEGTAGTAFVVRCRQGNGVGGALVSGGIYTVTLAAAASIGQELVWEDTSGFLDTAAGGQYTITVAETGATANGTVNNIYVEVSQ